jgi:LacI family transcriptional regulator
VTTLSEIARRAGVSVSVVSRLLNGDPQVRTRDETRERVLQIAKELRYTPNHAGRALRLARTKALALIVPDVSTPLFADVLAGAQDAADEAECTLLLGRSDRISDGSDTLRRLVANDARFVLVTSRTPGRRGSVVLDDVAGARVATEHLLSLGHTKIGLVSGVETSDIARRREEGYRSALHDAGLRRREQWTRRLGHGPATAALAIESLMATEPRPTAVVVTNVNGAIGALTAVRALGISVPHDLSIVAYHDQWMAAHTWPPLTTVKMPYYEVGFQAVLSLTSQLAGGPAQDIVVRDPAPELVLRGSTAPPL